MNTFSVMPAPDIDPTDLGPNADEIGWGVGIGIVAMVIIAVWIRTVTSRDRISPHTRRKRRG